MDSFPAFFPLAGRTVIIVGQGDAAEAKLRLFAGSPAALIRPTAEAAADSATYQAGGLVFIATADAALRQAALAAARAAGALVNVVDHPQLCDFVTPAVIDRGEVVAAIGTGGAAPILAGLLRQDIEARIPEGAGRLAVLLRQTQDAVREAVPDLGRRRAFLRAILAGPAAQAALDGDLGRARRLLDEALAHEAANAPAPGQVAFLAAGGPSELLSLRALNALAQADVLILAEGCDAAVVDLARRDARRLADATLAIEDLITLAQHGQKLVRLSPTPPDVGALKALAAAGVATEILPVAEAER